MTVPSAASCERALEPGAAVVDVLTCATPIQRQSSAPGALAFTLMETGQPCQPQKPGAVAALVTDQSRDDFAW